MEWRRTVVEVQRMGMRAQFGVVFNDDALTERQKICIECYQAAFNKKRKDAIDNPTGSPGHRGGR